jgi:hypothetical protein
MIIRQLLQEHAAAASVILKTSYLKPMQSTTCYTVPPLLCRLQCVHTDVGNVRMASLPRVDRQPALGDAAKAARRHEVIYMPVHRSLSAQHEHQVQHTS